MGRQRNNSQMKEENSPEELSEMDISNLSDIEFRVMIIRMFNTMNKDIKAMKYQSEMKNYIS